MLGPMVLEAATTTFPEGAEEEGEGPIGSPILTLSTGGPWSRWCELFRLCYYLACFNLI